MRPNPNLLSHELEGELVLYDPEKDVVHTLNSTARFIWKLCDKMLAPEEIARELTRRYHIDFRAARRDVDLILDQFRGRNLLIPDDPA